MHHYTESFLVTSFHVFNHFEVRSNVLLAKKVSDLSVQDKIDVIISLQILLEAGVNSVIRYSLLRGVEWSTRVSTAGANTTDVRRMKPTPGGGVELLVKEAKMANGFPVSPLTYVFTLVTVNLNGYVVSAPQLPDTDQNQNTYADEAWMLVDDSGDTVLVRQINRPTGVSSPATVPEIVIAMQQADGTVTTQGGSIGGVINAQTQYGFKLDFYNPTQFVASNDMIYLMAKCSGKCSSTDTKLYGISMTGFSADFPRGGVLTAHTPTEPSPIAYMALGDSFSSGEGVSPFVDTTACHRSWQAYSRVLGEDPASSLSLDKFVACSGATTDNVLNGWYDGSHSEAPQVNALLSGSPKVVTISIGGNDILFGEFATACVMDTCNFNSAAYAASLDKINTTLAGSLETTYKKILEVTKTSGAAVYVVGYPQVIADKSVSDPGDARCPYMYESVPVADGRYWEDARAARDIVTKLDAKIEATVDNVRGQDPDNLRLQFVSATGSDSPFMGHEVCGTEESYFQNVDQAVGNTAYVFHPNALGQAAYAELVRRAIGE